jgi:hypothetical protein
MSSPTAGSVGGFLPEGVRERAPLLTTTVIAALTAAVLTHSERSGLVLVAAAGVASVALLLPLRWMPAIGLATFVLFPAPYLASVPEIAGRYLSPAIVLVGCWGLRTLFTRSQVTDRGVKAVAALGGATAVWAAVRCWPSIEKNRSALWTAVLVVVVVLAPLAAARSANVMPLLMATWTGIVAAVGLLGVVEGVAKTNPLASHFETNGEVIRQSWSVYRIETTLGHPLLNGMFFATSAAMIAVYSLRRPSVLRLVAAALATLALVLTASRSGVIALVLGVAVGVLFTFFARTTSPGRKAAMAVSAGIVVLAVVQAPILKQRERSTEASSSAQYRQQVIETSRDEMRRFHYVGSGPGTSQTLLLRDGKNPSLESSVLQIGVSLGAPGVGGFALLLVAASVLALRRGRPHVVAGLIAYVTTAAGFNAWDSDPQTLAILGLLLILAAHPATAEEELA